MRHTLCCNIILFSIFIILTLGNFNIVKSFIPIKKIYGILVHIDFIDINKIPHAIIKSDVVFVRLN